jgi:HSP20 family protein
MALLAGTSGATGAVTLPENPRAVGEGRAMAPQPVPGVTQSFIHNLTPRGVLLEEDPMVAITRYRENPANLFGLQRLNRILGEAFAGLPFPEQGGNILTASWIPPTDVSEDANSIQISMELAGVNQDDVRISLVNNVLTIRGEKRQDAEENNERVHRFERIYGMFERTFVLPNTVDPERIEAGYKNGVLLVTIPKAERAKPREIQVKSSTPESSQVKSGSRSQRTGAQGSESSGSQTDGGQSSEQIGNKSGR